MAVKGLAEKPKSPSLISMSDPRNAAHARKVTQEEKHHGAEPQDAPSAQPGKKPRGAKKKTDHADTAPVSDTAATGSDAPRETAARAETPTPKQTPAALEGSLTVLAKLKEMEFHSRANLERLAELMLTVEDELKQKELAGPVGEVYGAQDTFQTKLTALIEAYKAECDRLQGESA